ncbi:uncharacterized protein LOC132620062 [Lycium barbarum]|uniref:uncharacterized protein LOC132620062 n=1 Tax=Lycium barbarum TaxID=112863 RepID=UPI00293E9C1A|nr:uncharacterized protein LOC132620062 [Lycium barbarum]
MPTGSAVNSKNTKWELPPLDTIKCNIDASYDIHTGLAGVGMVLRDHLGQFIAGKTIFIGRVARPLLAEIIGQALEGNLVNYSYFDALVFCCKILIKELLFFSLSSVKKLANQVARCLAKASASMSGSMEWNTISPSLITDVLAFDLNNT